MPDFLNSDHSPDSGYDVFSEDSGTDFLMYRFVAVTFLMHCSDGHHTQGAVISCNEPKINQ